MQTEWNENALQNAWWTQLWHKYYGTHTKRAIAIACGLLSFLFLRVDFPYGVYPLGPALLAGCAPAELPFAMFGALVALFIEQGDRVPLLASLLVTVLVRVWLCGSLKYRMFTEPLAGRVLSGTVGAILFSFYRLFVGGFRRYDLLGLAVGCAVAAVASPLLACVTHRQKQMRIAGGTALTALICYAFSEVTLLGLAPSLTIAATFCGVLLWYSGSSVACCAGLLCGLAGGSYPIPLALGALAGGLLGRSSQKAGLAGFPLLGAIYLMLTAQTLGAVAFLGATVPGVFFSVLLVKSGVVERFFNLKATAVTIEEPKEKRAEETAITRLCNCAKNMAETLKKLSACFSGIVPAEVISGCREDCRVRCRGCMYEDTCWQAKPTNILSVFSETITDLENDVRTATAKFAKRVPAGCPQQETLLQILQGALASARARVVTEDRMGVCAQLWERTGALYQEALERARADAAPNEALAVKVRAALAKLQIEVAEVEAYGSRVAKIILRDVSGIPEEPKLEMQTLVRLAHAIDMPLVPFVKTVAADGSITLTTERAPRIKAKLTILAEEKAKESISGDLIGDFYTSDYYYIALLCDGMGSGREAALRARLCKVVAGQMLGAGCSAAQTIAAISDVLRYTPGECFSTMDLLMVDLLDGSGKFVKSGATASYVLRKEKLYRIAACSLPLGITDEAAPEETRFAFGVGDVILLQSDGIVASNEDGWLTELLSEDRGEEIGALLGRILAEAKRFGVHPDDRTIGAVEIISA